MITNRMITAGALALALALAAAQNACANLASAPKDLREAPQDPQEVQEALQGEW